MPEVIPSAAVSRAWTEALDRFEADLLEAEALMTGNQQGYPPAWQAPILMPHIPETHADRAWDLLDRQTTMLLRLEAAELDVRRQMKFLSRDAIRGLGGGPRFIDEHA